MTEETEVKTVVISPQKTEVKEEEKTDYIVPGKIFIVSILGGLVAGLIFYIFEQLGDDKKKYIKEQVSTALKSQLKKWAEN